MKRITSIILIIFGFLLCLISIYPVFDMNKQVGESITEWEELKQDNVLLNEGLENDDKKPIDSKLIGLLQISTYDQQIPIRRGIDTDILKKGAGLDESTTQIGEKGNSVIYGHRENILWNLKHVDINDELIIETLLKKGAGLDESTTQIGEKGNSVIYGHRENILWNLKHVDINDELIIETLDKVLKFKIFDIKTVDPGNPYIDEKSQDSVLTLVTCYPFIYMGPTPQRYVVKARKIFDIKTVDPGNPYIDEKSQDSVLTLVTCYPFIYMGPTPQRYVVKARLIEES